MTQKTKLQSAARYGLGAIFTIFGLNGFFHFIPQPPMEAPAAAFAGALFATGYMFPLVKGTEVLAGALLLAGRYVPLALLLLAPVVVNIVAFHLFLAPGGLLIPFVTLALLLYLAWTERDVYAPLFKTPKASEASSAPAQEARTAAG